MSIRDCLNIIQDGLSELPHKTKDDLELNIRVMESFIQMDWSKTSPSHSTKTVEKTENLDKLEKIKDKLIAKIDPTTKEGRKVFKIFTKELKKEIKAEKKILNSLSEKSVQNRVNSAFTRVSKSVASKSSSLTNRKIVLILTDMLSCVKEFFFPSSTVKIQKKFEAIKTMKARDLTSDYLLGKGSSKLTPSELNILFNRYLDSKKGLDPVKTAKLKILMNLIAEADNLEELKWYKQEISELFALEENSDFKWKKHLYFVVETFVETFQKTHEETFHLIGPLLSEEKTLLESDLKVLLKHPNALKNTTIAKKIRRMAPSPLVDKLIKKLNKLELTILKRQQQREIALLEKLDDSLLNSFASHLETRVTRYEFAFKKQRGFQEVNDLDQVSRATLQNRLNDLHFKESLLLEQFIPELENYAQETKQQVTGYEVDFSEFENQRKAEKLERLENASYTEIRKILEDKAECILPSLIIDRKLPYQTEILEKRKIHLKLINEHFNELQELIKATEELKIVLERALAAREKKTKEILQDPEQSFPNSEILELDRKISEIKERFKESDRRIQQLKEEIRKLEASLDIPVYSEVEEALFLAASRFFDLIERNTKQTINPSLSKVKSSQIQLIEPLEIWYSDLQEIWVNHLPIEQEKAILAKKTKRDQEIAMADYFSDWIRKQTSLSLTLPPEKFRHIELSTRETERAEALKTLTKPLVNFAKKRKKTPMADIAPLSISKTLGVDSELAPPSLRTSSSLSLPTTPFETISRGSDEKINLIGFMQEAVTSFKSGDINNACEVVKNLHGNPLLQGSSELRSYLLSFCEEIIEASSQLDISVPKEIQEIFLEQFDPLNLKNAHYFKIFVDMICSGNNDLTVTEKERRYLTQINHLSSFPRALNLKIGTSNLNQGDLLVKLGKSVQDSPIGFEGLDESTLQLSFQDSHISNNPENRASLDALRARSDALSFQLLPYVMQVNRFSYHEESEAISRAILSAYRHNRDDVLGYIHEKIEEFSEQSLIDGNTLSPLEHCFYRDCLLEIDPTNAENNRVLKGLNQELIQSGDTSLMLLGFSREIVRLTLQKDPDPEAYLRLLKYKIGYQALRDQYFTGKKEIRGFLKNAVDAAENAILTKSPDLSTLSDLKNSVESVFKEEDDPFTDEVVGKLFTSESSGKWALDRGYLTYGRKAISLKSGEIYHDGLKCTGMPAHLQNHPDIRSLKLQDLPLVLDTNGSFVYFSENETGKQVPQLRIFEKDGVPVIQKKLRTDFKDTQKVSWVQFVPESDFKEIPYALACRMDIEQFWKSKDGSVYAYNSHGDLIAILKNQEIQIGDETFVSYGDKKSQPALNQICHCLSSTLQAGDILISQDEKSLWVPGLNLRFSLRKDPETQELIWMCKGPGMQEMLVDTSQSNNGYLSLRSNQESLGVKEAKDLLRSLKASLIRKLEEPKSLEVTYEITKLEEAIAKQKTKLEELQGKVSLVVMSDEGCDPEKTQALKLHFQKELKDLPVEQEDLDLTLPLFTIYRTQLNVLSKWLAENVSKCSDLKSREEYLQVDTFYKKLKSEYALQYKHPAHKFLFSHPHDRMIARDLGGALLLIQRDQNHSIGEYIPELSKYPISKMLDPLSLEMLKTIEKNSTDPEFKLYLKLMLLEHISYEMEELSRTPLTGKEERALSCQESFRNLNREIEELVRGNSPLKSPELQTLLRKTRPDLVPSRPKSLKITDEKAPSLLLAREIDALGDLSLFDRLHLDHEITATPKEMDKEISQEQKEFIAEFEKHSPDQVAGFYLEEFGLFQRNALFLEFQIVNDTDPGLFGMKREHVNKLVQLLEKKGIILQPSSHQLFYRVDASRNHHPLTELEWQEIKVLLKDLSPEEIVKVQERLQVFLSKAATAAFTFAFKNANAEKTAMEALAKEKAKHFEEMLLAEDFLKAHMPEGKTLADLKYALLTGTNQDDFPEFISLQNALTRYLVHKTEWQHIENIEKAPLKGERNRIELLSTKRQYSTHLLLKKEVSEEERLEQIIQRAFLCFEEDYGFRCNAMQQKLFRSLLLDSNHPEAIDAAQARMGFGKTALLPLMALVRVARDQIKKDEDKFLSIYVVPRAVIEDNTSSFNTRLSNVLGSHVVQDREFSRYQIDLASSENSFFMIKEDLTSRLNFYKQVRQEGAVLIQWPEIRGSLEAQELEFGRMITSGQLSEQALLECMECKKLIGELRSIKTYTVFDELDDTQDFKSRKVNYTCGEKQQMELDSIILLEKLLDCIKKKPRDLLRAMCESLELELSEDVRNAILGQKDIREYKIDEDDFTKVLLIRALFKDPYMMALAESKQPNTHFGVRVFEKEGKKVYSFDPESNSSLLIAVPYEGTNTPKGLSIFDNTEVTAITTIRYYASSETSFEKYPHLDFLLEQVKQNKIPKEIQKRLPPACLKELENISRLLGGEAQKGKDKFFNKYMQRPTPEFRTFFGLLVAATQIRSNTFCAKSDRYESGSRHNIVKGCSGTLGSTSSYFKHQANDPAADGKLSLEIFGRDQNAKVEVLQNVDGQNYLQSTLQNLLSKATPDTRAIIDAAGICKSRDGTPEAVVRELWIQLQSHEAIQGIKGIIYYGKDNIKRIYRGPGKPIEICTREKELIALKERSYFSFYGQKNTRGSDIKQALKAHAFLTFDENVSNSDAKQAALRFRDLVSRDSGQRFTFVITETLQNLIKSKFPKKAIDARSIANYLRMKEKDIEESDTLTIFKQEMSAHIKQAAAEFEHAILPSIDINNLQDRTQYLDFLERRNEIDSFVEKAILDLEMKYGRGIKEEDTVSFIKAKQKIALDKLQKLKELADEFSLKTIAMVNTTEIFEFYKERIKGSISQFIDRYKKETVMTSSNEETADKEAIAVAEAQAEAMAQAEVLALALSESEVEVLEGPPHLNLTMTHKDHIPVNLSFLQNPTLCSSINDFPKMRDLIHEKKRPLFKVSPCMAQYDGSVASHFLLENGSTAVFVTQEEAAAFTSLDMRFQGSWQLFDLRDPSPPPASPKSIATYLREGLFGASDFDKTTAINIAKVATLEKTSVPFKLPNATRELTDLINSPIQDQKPTLQASASTQAWCDLQTYGVTRSGSLTLDIDQTNKKVSIKSGKKEHVLQIPQGNKFVTNILARWDTLAPSNKAQKAYERAVEDSKAVVLKKTELEVKQRRAELKQAEIQKKQIAAEAKQKELRAIIGKTKAFEVTAQMEQGLRERDKEKASWNWVGAKFTSALEEINKAQRALQKENSTMSDLENLQIAFEKFINPSTLAAALRITSSGRSLNTTALFEKTEDAFTDRWWQGSKAKAMDPFDLVYGRILHSVHGSDVNDAAGCGRTDCKCMFSETLPALVQAIGSLTDSINQVTETQRGINQIQREIAGIQDEIETIQQEIQDLQKEFLQAEEALAFFGNLKTDTTIEDSLQSQGVRFAEKRLFWDKIHLEKFFAPPSSFPHSEEILWELPKYKSVIEELDSYQENIPLTEQEANILQTQRTFWNRLRDLSGNLERRAISTL